MGDLRLREHVQRGGIAHPHAEIAIFTGRTGKIFGEAADGKHIGAAYCHGHTHQHAREHAVPLDVLVAGHDAMHAAPPIPVGAGIAEHGAGHADMGILQGIGQPARDIAYECDIVVEHTDDGALAGRHTEVAGARRTHQCRRTDMARSRTGCGAGRVNNHDVVMPVADELLHECGTLLRVARRNDDADAIHTS